ncbi:MAG TPA: glycosyltransferase [Steroidobacteraceae bacterium]|nr:glycosyltransferase [Steroidobacteraceae bacterium]
MSAHGAARPALAYVVNTLNPGGTERLVVEMSLAFADEFDMQVFCLDEPGAWAERLRTAGIAVYGMWRQPGFDPGLPLRLARAFRESGVRIVHAHQCTAWFYAALARLSYSAPRLLLEEHGRFYPEVENKARAAVNRLLIRRLTHRFIAVSEDIRQRLVRYEGLDASQIEVIYNGVTPSPPLTPQERVRLRAQLGFGPEDFVVGTVGRFDPIKNLPMLVSSLRQSLAGTPRVHGLLVGDGPVMGEVRQLLAGAGLESRVRLTGYRSDARELVQAMDLFVLSSLSEGTSMALLEAMAAGIAVAVTDVGGNPEVVVRDVTGWVVPSGDVEALSRVIEWAAADRMKRDSFACAGKQRFENEFSMGRMIERYRGEYHQMLDPGLATTRASRI